MPARNSLCFDRRTVKAFLGNKGYTRVPLILLLSSVLFMFSALGGGLYSILFWKPPEPRPATPIPYDDNHQVFYTLDLQNAEETGLKKCEDCHNDDGIRFSENHPDIGRACLMCHHKIK